MDRATRISEKLARLWVKLGVLGGHLWRRPGDGLIAEPPEAGASTDATQAYRDAVHRAFEWISDTIRIAMLALVGFAFFCVVTTLGASDISLFELEPRIKAPLVDVTMSFPWFLVVAPIVLVGIVIYLHIFVGSWIELETLREAFNQIRQSDEPRIDRLPALLSLRGLVPRALTGVIL